MDRIEFAALVDRVAASSSVFEALPRDPVASDEDVAAFESRFNLKVPLDYKWFAQRYGGGVFGTSIILSIGGSGDYPISETVSLLEVEPMKFLPIVNCGTGDYYGYSGDDSGRVGLESQVIWSYDHEDLQIVQSAFEDLYACVAEICLANLLD